MRFLMVEIMKRFNPKIFLSLFAITALLVVGGCSKNVTAPEVEAPPETASAEAVPEEEIAESVFEQDTGFDIREDGSPVEGGEFISESGEVPVEPGMEPVAEESNLGGAAPDFDTSGSQSDFSGSGDTMSLQDEAFAAAPVEEAPATETEFFEPAAPEEPVVEQEARLLPFKNDLQLKDIQFAYDRYDLDEDTKAVLQNNANWLRSNPDAKVEIQGHCDERGTNNYNLGLGERRAQATKNYLVALGVEQGRLFTISYGEEKPFCFQSNEGCWRDNRRAHFMVAE